ncbi:MAG: RNA-directed DNA polymerase [Proteobacteria bacterium]|nr:RNA-directed DNA polymerase [Pseudomonadota bacterium]
MTKEILNPRMDLLSKEYVLIQAWKKTAAYIRYHNWFADTLALDQAAVNLPRFLAKIAERLQNPDQWTNTPLRIVPAPKSQQWQAYASGKWEPLNRTETANKIRPLAHAVLEDQVVATAILLCLADRLETSQGDPRESIENKDKRNLVSSYGNRLFCETYAGGLRHRWGSTKLYRGFFEDYQKYLARPELVATQLSLNKKTVIIVQSDLKSFYDTVTPSLLAKKISGLQKEKDDPAFFDTACRILCWEWDHRDNREVLGYANRVGLENFSRVALPQGLVSAGFFSNIVLLDFDEMIRAEIENTVFPGVILHDMCRYVDDIRLVFEVEGKCDLEELEEDVVLWLQQLLDRNTVGLKVSPEKTKAVMFGGDERALVRQGRKMRQIQHAISGGFDAIKGGEILDAVRALVRTQERYSAKKDKGQGWKLTPVPDVGDETVTRFSASRFRSTYRSLRPLLDSQEETKAEIKSHKNDWKSLRRTQADLDDDAKTFALGLIENWVEDPSNVRLLRIGLDLWPDVDVLKPVLDILLKYTLKGVRTKAAKRIAFYCLSEIFRAGATETGFVDDNERLPKNVDIKGYRALLQQEALNLMAIPALPWYLQQQILLYLATNNPKDTPMAHSGRNPETRHYKKLIRYLKGEVDGLTDQDFATFAVLSRRSFLNKDNALLLANATISVNRAKLIAEIDPSMGMDLIAINREISTSIPLKIRRNLCLEKDVTIPDGYISLADHILSGSELLRNELSLLDFALKFLSSIPGEQKTLGMISPNNVLIKIISNAVDNEFFVLSDLKIVATKHPKSGDALYSLPDWLPVEDNWQFQLGFLLRFILTAQIDFTQTINKTSWKEGKSIYRSPISHWHQRLYALYNGHSAFGSDWLPISDWIEHLLYALLAWPGCATPDFSEWVKKGINEAILQIEKRIFSLTKKQGEMSKTFILPLSSSWPSRKPTISRSLRACVVQTVIPGPVDFDPTDLSLSEKANRRKHRNHLSAALAAVDKMLYLRKTHNGSDGNIDLLVFPELSVHPDDVKTHLEPFARANKTIILAGLTYEEVFKGKPLINSALWVIPVWSPIKGLEILLRRQGKKHLAKVEQKLNDPIQQLQGFRPCQWLVGYEWNPDAQKPPLWMTASICYDATDLRLAADLRGQSDLFIVPALNRDVTTFDQMALALHYHMYQMVIVVNNGTYGGSNAYAPYREPFKRQIFHLHGQPQASIAFMEIDNIGEFLNRLHNKNEPSLPEREEVPQTNSSLNWKYPPAGLPPE